MNEEQETITKRKLFSTPACYGQVCSFVGCNNRATGTKIMLFTLLHVCDRCDFAWRFLMTPTQKDEIRKRPRYSLGGRQQTAGKRKTKKKKKGRR